MPEITFPEPEPRYVFERDCLALWASVDGTLVNCFISAELLYSRFGAKGLTEEDMRQAYRGHEAEIQAIARSHIENGWIDQNNRVFLTHRYTRLTVAFGDRLGQRTPELALAENAHRVLLDLIGPTAEEVSVEWNDAEDDRRRTPIRVRITDPVIPWSVSTILHSKDWEEPAWLQIHLAQLWGSLLQARSRDLMLKSG